MFLLSVGWQPRCTRGFSERPKGGKQRKDRGQTFRKSSWVVIILSDNKKIHCSLKRNKLVVSESNLDHDLDIQICGSWCSPVSCYFIYVVRSQYFPMVEKS